MTFEFHPDRLFMLACALLLAVGAYGLGYAAGWKRGRK